MYRYSKSAVVFIPVIAGLLSLSFGTSALAQNAGRRHAVAEQETPVTEEDKEKVREKRPMVRGEQARTEQQQEQQAARESREQQGIVRQQENQRGNAQADIERQRQAREEVRQRQQATWQEDNNRQRDDRNSMIERNAAAERLAAQREATDLERQNRDNRNQRPIVFDRVDERENNRGRENNRDDDREGNRERGNDNNRQNPIPMNKLPRPEQERQQRQWQDQQQRQANDYRRHLDSQQSSAQRFTQRLREQNRNEQYRSQQRYYDRMRQQRHQFDGNRYDYSHGSYFYSPIIYRYSRGGHNYYANRYQADLMRQAIDYGYEEGFYAGRADRMDRWGYNFREAYAYQDANYGYYGYYIDRGTYNYYFREGFRRGYDDGYYGRYRYGRYDNNRYSPNDSIIRLILNLTNWR